ncbi:MAG: hypothetical protein PHF86_08675 [Candidatus Nanoarchaeia archaeon]|jgi:hypothetical protein|nr:hypothetical protein [Candidatus Nanoarchaeia archaeon]
MLYFYPNKPVLITVDSTKFTEISADPDWWAEIKKNGSRLALRNDPTEASQKTSFNGFVFWNRHKEVLSYQPSTGLLDELMSFKIPPGCHIDAELLHQKTKHIKHYIYVYDIYWYKGLQVMESLEVRRKMIEDIFGGKHTHFTLSKLFPENFRSVYDEAIKDSENEGLVMKNKNGKIQWNLKDCPEVWWQMKVRKPSNSYQF